jgi:hypothetical protein
MDLCYSPTLNETWNCLREENGELLPLILFAECMWWIFMLVIMRGIVQGIRRWREKKKLGKRMRQEWEDKWSFPPKRKN